MAHRQIKGLHWAELSSSPHTKVSRPRGAKALGLRFERAAGRALGKTWTHGQWYRYCDSGGIGYCQPDFTHMPGEALFVIECKLTDTQEAEGQLRELYYPVLKHYWRVPVFGIVLVRHLTTATPRARVVDSLGRALAVAPLWRDPPILHWLGKGPLD